MNIEAEFEFEFILRKQQSCILLLSEHLIFPALSESQQYQGSIFWVFIF